MVWIWRSPVFNLPMGPEWSSCGLGGLTPMRADSGKLALPVVLFGGKLFVRD